MENTLVINVKEVEQSLRTKVGRAYECLGLPKSQHLYDIRKVIKKTYCDSESIEFLYKLHSFYVDLLPYEKGILINDYLEKSDAFPFWYESFFNKRTYVQKQKQFALKVLELL